MHEVSLERQEVKKTGFIYRYFQDIRMIILMVFILVAAGIVVFNGLPKELNPSIKIPIVTIVTVYPGASPDDVKELVTVPLEDAVTGLGDITKASSTSKEGVSIITLEFASRVDPDKAKQDVQDKVDAVTGLPTDAQKSNVAAIDFQDQPVYTFALTGAPDSESLRLIAKELEDKIKEDGNIKKVNRSYDSPLNVMITLQQERILAAGIQPMALADELKRILGNTPGGSLTTAENTFALGIDRRAFTLDDIRNTPVTVNGKVVFLRDVATVTEEVTSDSKESFAATASQEPQQATLFSVYKTDGANADETVVAIQAATDAVLKKYPNGTHAVAVFDGAKEIQKSFSQLFHDFFLTVGLVSLILIVFFGLRQSVVASFAIPLTFLITFLLMGIMGISINFIALLSLLLALGILVDNVIVVISAMASYERLHMYTPLECALLVWRDFRGVIFTTTITTIWAFLPLLLASGIIGEFIKPIPIVVSSVLAVSALVALFVVTPFMAVLQQGNFAPRVRKALKVLGYLLLLGVLLLLVPAGPYALPLRIAVAVLLALLLWQAKNLHLNYHDTSKTHWVQRISDEGLLNLHTLSARYAVFIRGILESRKKRRLTFAMLLTFAFFSYLLLPLGYVVNEFFPSDDQETVYVTLELPKGTNSATSAKEAERMLNELRSFPNVTFALAQVGAGMPTDGTGGGAADAHEILVTLLLTSKDDRDVTSTQIVTDLNRQFQTTYTQGKFTANQPSSGPPAGSDIQIKLLGEDPAVLNTYAQQLKDFLAQQQGVSQIENSYQTGSGKITFIPHQQKIAALGVSEGTLAYWVRALGSGQTLVSDARFGDDKQDIVLRLQDTSFASPDAAAHLMIPTTKGQVPLQSLGDFVLTSNPTEITREDGKQTLSISAAVGEGASVTQVNAALEKFAETLALPDGYSWKTGGVNEENQKSVQSILQAMLLSALLIFATMTIQFHSFRKALIVLLVIPFAVSGVFVVFALTGTPLSFPALIGVLALFGIVVNNSIIMVDKINKNMEQNMELRDAIVEGASSRMEPILLTAFTAIVGLIPITLSDPIWQGLGGAIIAGLLFSGVAKLLAIPLMYWFFFGEKEAK